MFKKTFTCVLFILSLAVSGQDINQLTEVQTQQIDSLFLAWNAPNHPGGAIGVMQDGKTVYSKSFGLASLEYLVPNSTETIFNTGSVSKQFTAMAIVLLHIQNKLSVDDDIRKHIPELPDFGDTITIRHMLHHTSGLRSLHALFGLAGWRGDDSRTNEDLNRIILNQKDLNFKPGDEYLYCNTGYMLMVNIVENVTGEKFKDWIKNNVFDPLGMHNTYVEDEYSRIVPNNATSYYGGNNFDRAVEYWGYIGSGNMHSTTNDLLKWTSNFYSPTKGWEKAFQLMETVDTFNDGTLNNYAFGVTVDKHLGKKRVQHGGAIGGFRAYSSAYPDEKLNIAVLTNFSSGNPGGNAGNIARIILGEENSESSSSTEINGISLPTSTLNSFEGTYWNDRDKYSRKIYLKQDTLRYSRSETNETSLIPIKGNSFRMLGLELTVSFKNNSMLVALDGESASVFNKIENSEATDKELSEYIGSYYSPEVETTYTISLNNGELNCYQIRHGNMPMSRLFKDVLSADYPIGVAQVKRDKRGKVEGLLVTNGRVRNLWFKKQ